MRPIRIVLVVVAAAILLTLVGFVVSVVLFGSGDSGPEIVTIVTERVP